MPGAGPRRKCAVAATVGLLALPASRSIDNGLGLTPILGWRSWNAYHTNITQDIIIRAAEVLAAPRPLAGSPPNTSSFKDLGFVYVGIDEGWAKCGAGVNGSFHRIDGTPIVDESKFPDLKQLTARAHALGLKAGWYAACDGCAERSWVGAEHIATHMRGTVNAIVEYGFDSVKLDSGSEFNNLTWWAELLNATGRRILIENCHQGRTTPGGVVGPNQKAPYPGNNQSNAPCSGLGGRLSNCPYNLFRTSADITNTWASLLNNLNSTRPYQGTPPLSRPGAWAYADMLEVGRMGSLEEDRTMFGAWVIVSSPLILGHDVTNETQNDRVWSVVAKPRAIGINQAWHGHPGRFVRALDGALQLWAKPLSEFSHAAFVFNDDSTGSTEPIAATIDLTRDLGVPAGSAPRTKVYDVWGDRELGPPGPNGTFLTASLQPRDSTLLVFAWT